MPSDVNQFSTSTPIAPWSPEYVEDEFEAARLASYDLYERIYWTVPETFKLVQRGEDQLPIYIPSGRSIVETLHRYLANDMQVIVDPDTDAQDSQIQLATQVIEDFMARERFYSKFNANKRFGIIRGDWIFHLYADETREPGSKISIFAVDPSNYFPIYNPDNVDEVIGCHIIRVEEEDDETTIRRLTYRKTTETGGPSPITVEEARYEVDDWGGPGMDPDPSPIEVLMNPTALPAPIDHIPVYHIPHFAEPSGTIYGSSEMRGLERIMAGLDQSISDEDLALALEALGVYATDAGAPIDPSTGAELSWNIGPGRVVEVPSESSFKRVGGVGSVSPYQDHLKYLHEQIDLASGQPAIAKGKIDVQTAESGVALMLQLGPMLSRAIEKEQVVTDVMKNMLFDLAKWFVAYEGGAFRSLMENTRWIPVYGDKVPPNRKQQFNEIMQLAKAKLIPMKVAWAKLREIGMDLPEDSDMESQLIEETAALAAVEADAIGNRIDQEMGGNEDEG